MYIYIIYIHTYIHTYLHTYISICIDNTTSILTLIDRIYLSLLHKVGVELSDYLFGRKHGHEISLRA